MTLSLSSQPVRCFGHWIAKRPGWCVFFLGFAVLAGSMGCQIQLMATPNLFVQSEADPFANVPEAFQNNKVDVLYITDREPEEKKGKLCYGYGRSDSVACGSVVVEFGDDVSWETLVRESRTDKRKTPLPVKVGTPHEILRAPPSPPPLVEIDGELVSDPKVVAQLEEIKGDFVAEISRRLAMTPRKEAYVYVHGFNNTFDYAVGVVAQFWHFLGRSGIPISYSWPAGRGSDVRGYNYDRESGEFTIFHLKNFLKLLAQVPELEKVHLISHSRGTDVATTALRELHIEFRAAGKDTQEELKLENLVLASADLDLEVIRQRLGAERMADAANRITLYTSPKDKALGFASWLFESEARLGDLEFDDLDEGQKRNIAVMKKIQVIKANVPTGALGHSYYYQQPAVSSDLILLLRDSVDAGSEQRPMRHVGQSPMWQIDEGYPFVEEKSQ